MHNFLIANINTNHDSDFIMKRAPDPSSSTWIVLCCINDCMIHTALGIKRAIPGDCFIKSPDFLEYHYTPCDSNEGFENDWIHLRSSTMENTLNMFKLTPNVLIRTNQPDIIRTTILRILSEEQNQYPLYEQFINNLIEQMFLKIARAVQNEEATHFSPYSDKLLKLRHELYNDYQKNWTIEMMSNEIGLSSSRFAVLYKKRFGISPNNDLIQIRLHVAKMLLLSTNKKTGAIAKECGFKNEYYFSRIFKSRENISPSGYRNAGIVSE